MVRIHPGQFCCSLLRFPPLGLRLLAGCFALGVLVPGAAGAQEPSEAARDAVARARAAQSAFESQRVRWLPMDMQGGYGGSCDEILGRMCLHLGEVGDWWPQPDDTALVRARDELLEVLAEAMARAPGDAWIAGQRVAYLGEAGRWSEAAGVAAGCRALEPGWCAALEALALHGDGRYEAARAAFDRALAAMPVEVARAWSDLDVVLDPEARSLAEKARAAGGEAEEAFQEQVWRFSDPLYLAPGNDRRTEHLARRVMARIREDARNPFGMAWGRDLEELLLRYGWEFGWQRSFPRPGDFAVGNHVIGQHHPHARPYLPPGAVLADPAGSRAADWNPAGRRQARTGYAPPYAPVILPPPVEVAVFPGGDSVRVVASVDLPADTTYHGGHGHSPLPVPARLAFEPDREGLFLVPLDGGPVRSVQRPAGAEGAMALSAPAGDYVVSVERWSPARGRAGRHRMGLSVAPLAPDVPALSDLLLVDAGAPDASLAALLPFVEPVDSLAAGARVRVAWEVMGLGWRRESLRVELGLRRQDGGLFRAAGRFLGLLGDPPGVTLAWSEAGPERPGPWFRSVVLDLPRDLPGGRYELRLRVLMPGREPLTTRRELLVAARR